MYWYIIYTTLSGYFFDLILGQVKVIESLFFQVLRWCSGSRPYRQIFREDLCGGRYKAIYDVVWNE